MPRTASRLLGGRYRAGALIGEGAMCTVSCGKDELLGRTVAIKLLKPLFCGDEEFIARLYAEARAAAKIAHPHVVAVYDLLDEPKTHAIVMEYVEGGSLAELLAESGTLDEARTVRYVREVAQALGAAHEQGVFHRDIKPSNLLLTAQDSIKVADFGLAKALKPTDLTLTRAGHIVGSVHYFSPEQAQGLTLSPASDLYSLGIVAYQLLSGQLPFQSESAVATAVAHVTQPAPARADLERFMSPPLAAVVERLLQKDPSRRFGSAAELEMQLAAIGDARGPSLRRLPETPTLIVAQPNVPPPDARFFAAFWGWCRKASQHVGSRPLLIVAGLLLLALLGAEAASLVRGPGAATGPPRVVRSGPPMIAVPNLVGHSLLYAGKVLKGTKLRPAFAAKITDAPANTIIEEQPAAGSRVREYSHVLFVVSTGPSPQVYYSGGGDGGD